MESFAVWYSEKNKEQNKCEKCTSKRQLQKERELDDTTKGEIKNMEERSNLCQKKEIKCPWEVEEKNSCKSEEVKKKSNLDIHLNLWKVKCLSKDEDKTFLDIGFKIKKNENMDKIHLYIPLQLQIKDVIDLGGKIGNNLKILNGIFNDTCSIESDKVKNGVIVTRENEEFYIETLDCEFQENLKVMSRGEGSIITIDIDRKEEDRDTYYRFRILPNAMKKFGNIKSPRYKFFRTEDVENHIIDFRLNEKRAFPESLSNLIAKGKEFRIGTIHFLLMTSSEYELTSSGLNYTVRALENNLWDQYIPEDCNAEELLGYHWKEKGDSLNAYIKIQMYRQNVMMILKYIIVAVIIGIVTNIISEVIMNSFEKLPLVGLAMIVFLIGLFLAIVANEYHKFSKSKK